MVLHGEWPGARVLPKNLAVDGANRGGVGVHELGILSGSVIGGVLHRRIGIGICDEIFAIHVHRDAPVRRYDHGTQQKGSVHHFVKVISWQPSQVASPSKLIKLNYVIRQWRHHLRFSLQFSLLP